MPLLVDHIGHKTVYLAVDKRICLPYVRMAATGERGDSFGQHMPCRGYIAVSPFLVEYPLRLASGRKGGAVRGFDLVDGAVAAVVHTVALTRLSRPHLYHAA